MAAVGQEIAGSEHGSVQLQLQHCKHAQAHEVLLVIAAKVTLVHVACSNIFRMPAIGGVELVVAWCTVEFVNVYPSRCLCPDLIHRRHGCLEQGVRMQRGINV